MMEFVVSSQGAAMDLRGVSLEKNSMFDALMSVVVSSQGADISLGGAPQVIFKTMNNALMGVVVSYQGSDTILRG